MLGIYNAAVIKKYKKNWNELTGWERMDLQGKVKQLMQTTYSAHLEKGQLAQGKIDIDSDENDPNFVVTFNEQGVAICEETFTYHGSKKEYFRNANEQVLAETFDVEGKRTEKKEYRYDGLVFIELVIKNGEGKQTSRVTNKYNDQGKVAEMLSFRNDPEELMSRRAYTYDKDGRMLTHTEYDGKDQVQCHTETRYNDKGLAIYRSTEWSKPEMANYNKKQEMKYNEHGDCIQVDDFDLDGNHRETHHYKHEYDSNGKRIVPDIEEDEKVAGEDEDVFLDKHGNWTKKTTYHNKIPVSIVVREIVYFDDEEQKELVHPLKDPETRTAHTREAANLYPEMKAGEAKWVTEGMPQPEFFSAHRYYVTQFNEVPSVVHYNDQHIDALALLKELKKFLNACEVHSYITVSENGFDHFASYALAFPDADGYLFTVTNIGGRSKDLFEIPGRLDDASTDYVYCGKCTLLRPAEATGERKEYFEQQLEDCLQKCSLKKREEAPRIHIIEVEGPKFSLTEYPVDDDFVIKDLDMHYGYGFERFHNELMKKFSGGSKGLVLFNGEPGTGKTYYIRHLLRKMTSNNKVVIYMPPNMVDHLTEPVFMTFLTGEIRSFSAGGMYCVLLIEDAEPLLANRESVVRNQGITNLLNMTDGILNDLLNLQIICTFNTKVEELDPALLRPGRLIAKKEFKPLPVIDANRLAKRLGIKQLFQRPATLGEIYAKRENAGIITHDLLDDETGSTTVDDLIR